MQTAPGPGEEEDVTSLLQRWSAGDAAAGDALFPRVYGELRRIAQQRMARERSDHTLQGTALVHEAFLRLAGQRVERWQNRGQFLGLASQMMRRVLVDHARQRAAAKRGAMEAALSLDDTAIARAVDSAVARETLNGADHEIDLLSIDRALDRLAGFDPQQARIVELRYFGGLSIEQIAEAIGLSLSTVKREWTLARAWLRRELARSHIMRAQ